VYQRDKFVPTERGEKMDCKKCKRELPEGAIYCYMCGAKQTVTPRKTIKRENGSGSVYKRSDLRRTPWVALTPGTQQVIGYYRTAQEAKDALEDYRRNPTTKLNITLKQLYDEWKPVGTKGKSQKLIYGYDGAIQKLYPLHDVKFRELRTAQMQQVINELQTERQELDEHGQTVMEDGKPKMLEPLGYSSLSKIKILLGLLYKYAMANDIVHKNYASFIALPPRATSVKDCFNDIDLKKLANSSGKEPFADWILFMCYTGLRITEFLHLTKTSVHYHNGVYSLYGGIKTEAGKTRVVPIHSKIEHILKARLEQDSDYLFANENGRPYDPKVFRKRCFYPTLERLKITRLSPHATRRTFATMLSKANVREEDFIAMMGHSDYKVDIDSYIVQSTEKLRGAIEKLS
jgi:integrase/recombinase XerD